MYARVARQTSHESEPADRKACCFAGLARAVLNSAAAWLSQFTTHGSERRFQDASTRLTIPDHRPDRRRVRLRLRAEPVVRCREGLFLLVRRIGGNLPDRRSD